MIFTKERRIMDTKLIFTAEEKRDALLLLRKLREATKAFLRADDEKNISLFLKEALRQGEIQRDAFGLNPVVLSFQTALIAIEEAGLKRDGVLAIILYTCVFGGHHSIEEIRRSYGQQVATIIHGLVRIQELYKKNPVIESENFRNLLLSFAEDMRVILIMIADRVNLMRQIRDTHNLEAKRQVSEEATYLYAPLAHKLGLYKLKSELEDISLKYLEHDAYYLIKEKLNETKQSRESYIDKFIAPVEQRLKEAGLHFHIKGRTKSIHSIWQKMKKQKCGFEGVYDLFAIRVIIESDNATRAQEHALCWQTFAIITNMYQGNPKRLRDWLSVPKSNGYESLHITVLGPDQKWVEVQIRTERMDEIAERGLAAHWRYKGVKSGGNMDDWLNSIRTALENNDDRQVMDEFKMNLYEDEVYVFTPKGDLLKFPKGATVLDFAYHIHSRVGNQCTANQRPKQDWLSIVKTSRAKAKIRQALKVTQDKEVLMAKEMLERRMKNRKIELEESVINHLVKKLGFKETRDFYKQIADGQLELNAFLDKYVEMQQHLNGQTPQNVPQQSAEEFVFENPNAEMVYGNDDVIIIDKNLRGVDFSLAKCCHPIYGDKVFGFVTVNGGIKIHRQDCPNAPEMRKRFGYRIVRALWSGKGSSQYSIVLRIIGNDDIGIVNNITSIISKEEKIMMRSINIDSHDGLFSGNLTVNVDDTSRLEQLIRKLRTVRGVKQVTRL